MTERVDANVPRFNQACVALFVSIAFVLGYWPLVAFVGIVLALTRFVGPNAGLFTQVYVRLVRPRVGGEIETELAAPPRFAQLLAVILLGSATMAFIAGYDAVGWALALAVAALAALAATLKICVGCLVFEKALR